MVQLIYSVIPLHSLIQHTHTSARTHTYNEHRAQALSFDHGVAEKKTLVAAEVTAGGNAWKKAFRWEKKKPVGTETLI